MGAQSAAKIAAIAGLVPMLSGCAGVMENHARWQVEQASVECAKVGYIADHPQHQECIASTVAAWQAQGRRDNQELLAGALLFGGAVGSGYAQAGQAAAMSPGYRAAPLVGNETVEYSRYCTYQTNTGPVTLTIPSIQMCPAQYAY